MNDNIAVEEQHGTAMGLMSFDAESSGWPKTPFESLKCEELREEWQKEGARYICKKVTQQMRRKYKSRVDRRSGFAQRTLILAKSKQNNCT